MFVLTLIMPKGKWAFSSVGRASPLQGEGQKFESSNAHHKRPDDISCGLRAEAGELLPRDEITKAKLGIAVQREQTKIVF